MSSVLVDLNQRFSTQINQRPVFYHDWVAAEKQSCFVVRYDHIYLLPSIKKNLLIHIFLFWLDKVLFCSLIGTLMRKLFLLEIFLQHVGNPILPVAGL
jgi:hypothetical protein